MGAAKLLLALSHSDDPATLHAEVPSKTFFKRRAGAPIRLAKAVLAFGYPLPGALAD